MNLTDVLGLLAPDVNRSLAGLAPEIILVITIVMLLVIRLFQRTTHWNLSGVALLGVMVACIISVLQMLNLQGVTPQDARVAAYLAPLIRTSSSASGIDDPVDLFTGVVPVKRGPGVESVGKGMLRFDGFTVFFRIFLCAFTAFIIWLTKLTGIPDNEDSPDFYTLLLGATLGMSLMASSNHLLMVYIAVGMARLLLCGVAGFWI